MFHLFCSRYAILDRIKWKTQTPIPLQIKDEEAQKPKRATFPSLIWGWGWWWWGGGGYKFSIYFVQAEIVVYILQKQKCLLQI